MLNTIENKLSPASKKTIQNKRTREKNTLRKTMNCPTYKDPRDLFTFVHRNYPNFIQLLLNDLFRVEGYSEIEIAFGLRIPLHVIRKIAGGEYHYVTRDIFLAILGLYARVFCGWADYHEEMGLSLAIK